MQVEFKAAILEFKVKEYEKDGQQKSFRNLFAYEYGREYPELTKINVSPELENMAKSAVGKSGILRCELRQFRGQVNYSLVSVNG